MRSELFEIYAALGWDSSQGSIKQYGEHLLFIDDGQGLSAVDIEDALTWSRSRVDGQDYDDFCQDVASVCNHNGDICKGGVAARLRVMLGACYDKDYTREVMKRLFS